MDSLTSSSTPVICLCHLDSSSVLIEESVAEIERSKTADSLVETKQDTVKHEGEDDPCNIVPACYIKAKNIKPLMDFLMALVIVDMPENPLTFLLDKLDDLMKFRDDRNTDPPRLYNERHINALVHAFDPGNTGEVTACAWKRAFVTIGLPEPESIPDELKTTSLKQLLLRCREDFIYNMVASKCTCAEKTPPISIKSGDSLNA